jgi:pimeloyl-ACP methyl ester carboxylesterase
MKPKLSSKTSVIISLCFATALMSCLKNRNSAFAQTPEVADTLDAEMLWESYVLDVKKNGSHLQPQCEPVLKKHSPTVPYQGAIVLYHGFTPCPQQYFELAEIMNKEGFDVYLPLNPGHGRMWNNANQDDISQLPTFERSHDYDALGLRMNKIMEELPGVKMIGGLSMGAAIAVVAAAQAKEGTYSRMLLLSPYFSGADFKGRAMYGIFKNTLGNPILSPALAPLRNQFVGWGKGCQVRERNGGRAGICDFLVTHGMAIESIGERALNASRKLKIPTQMVRVAEDKAANSGDMHKAIKNIAAATHGQAWDAVYPVSAKVNHSLLSRYDSPDENKYWISPLLEKSRFFLTTGHGFEIE